MDESLTNAILSIYFPWCASNPLLLSLPFLNPKNCKINSNGLFGWFCTVFSPAEQRTFDKYFRSLVVCSDRFREVWIPWSACFSYCSGREFTWGLRRNGAKWSFLGSSSCVHHYQFSPRYSPKLYSQSHCKEDLHNHYRSLAFAILLRCWVCYLYSFSSAAGFTPLFRVWLFTCLCASAILVNSRFTSLSFPFAIFLSRTPFFLPHWSSALSTRC